MFSLSWIFVGMLVGLLIVCVFSPQVRNEMGLPVPNLPNIFHTATGCVKFKTLEVPCDESAGHLA